MSKNPENKGGELAKPQVNPQIIKQKVSDSLLHIRGQVEAKEAEIVEAVLAEVLPTFLGDLERTSPDRIANLVSQKAEERAGKHLSDMFSGFEGVAAEIAQEARQLIAV